MQLEASATHLRGKRTIGNGRYVTVLEILKAATAPQNTPVPTPGAMLVFAHPDDEVIAMGARMARFHSAHFVHVTDGAPRNEQDSRAHGFSSLEEYRSARAGELRHALEMAGLRGASYECLGISDQDASLQLLELTRRLLQLCEERRPTVIFTHPYEGGHPDHDACAFAVYHAVALLGSEMKTPPLIIEGAFYHTGPNGIETGCFLPHGSSGRELVYRLSAEERRRKQALLACFATQQQTLSYFNSKEERFRIGQVYNFRQPPQTGRVFYDRFPWGMTSQRFCEIAAEAENTLQAEAIVTCR